MRLPVRLAAITLAGSAATLAVSACSDDATQRTEAHYCTEVANHLADLGSPVIATDADVERVVKAWRTVAESAPLQIEPEWTIVLTNVETASTVDPADPASVQRVADTARASEQASNRVISYTLQRCGAQIGTAPAAP